MAPAIPGEVCLCNRMCQGAVRLAKTDRERGGRATVGAVPGQGREEIGHGPEDDPAKQWLQAHGQALVRKVTVPPVILAWNLGLGESEVLAWAYENPGYEAILDDRAARNCALSLSLPFRGTISILLLAKKSGHLKEITSILLRLEQVGFRIDPLFVSPAQNLSGEE